MHYLNNYLYYFLKDFIKILLCYIYDSYSTLICTIVTRYLELNLAFLVVKHLDN